MIGELFKKYREQISYLFFGVMTTLVNWVSYYLFAYLVFGSFDIDKSVSKAIAVVIAVIFAFVVNKLFVFESKGWSLKTISKELTGFLGARIFSFLVEEGGMFLFVSVLGMGEKALSLAGITITGQLVAKILLAVGVVALNYIFSKFFIFKKVSVYTVEQ